MKWIPIKAFGSFVARSCSPTSTKGRARYSFSVFLVLLSSSLLGGCFSGGFAPISQLGVSPQPAPHDYRVRRGDTLYSIAWNYGLDYRRLAQLNHLSRSYQIWPGQRLVLKQQVRHQPIQATKKSTNFLHKPYVPGKSSAPHWGWPAKGIIIQGFKPGFTGNAGVDIQGYYGEPVRAAADGLVVYSSDGVRGYGNLIIIKHGDEYLSAYAFNRENVVTVGSRVVKGQQVAAMGRNNEGKAVLHFEIRHNGKPIDPVRALH